MKLRFHRWDTKQITVKFNPFETYELPAQIVGHMAKLIGSSSSSSANTIRGPGNHELQV